MSEPWLQHYDPGIPKTIVNYPQKTLVDLLRDHASANPEQTALLFKGKRISWGQIDRESDALAHALEADGVKRGDRVALLLPNCPQFIIAEMAVWKLGAIVVAQNPIYTARELEESLAASKPETIIVLTPFYERVKEIQARTSVRHVIATNIKEYLPFVLRVAFTLLKERKEGHAITLRQGDSWMSDLIAGGAWKGAHLAEAQPGDPAIILMSGGTTGTPKGVLGTHKVFAMAGTQLATWLKEPLSGENASLMLPLPLFHTYGCVGAQGMAFVAGIPMILIPNPRDLGDLLKSIDRDRPTLLCAVPTLFNAMMLHKDVISGKVDLRSIRACFSGAAALLAETKKRFEELTGSRIVEGYSLTEANMACCVNPVSGENKIGSVGMPLPDVKIRIVDEENGRTAVPLGKIGEVVLWAPQMMEGYFDNPEETAQVLRLGDDGSPWLYTGDLGYLDEDGYLFLVDRKKDLIKTSGYQVWPREVEEVIMRHPAVAEVGVAGVPDAHRSEVICAWVVLRPEAKDVLPAEIRNFCKQHLAPYKIPTRIEIRSELPKTMVGKVLRRVLVAEAKEHVEEMEPADVL